MHPALLSLPMPVHATTTSHNPPSITSAASLPPAPNSLPTFSVFHTQPTDPSLPPRLPLHTMQPPAPQPAFYAQYPAAVLPSSQPAMPPPPPAYPPYIPHSAAPQQYIYPPQPYPPQSPYVLSVPPPHSPQPQYPSLPTASMPVSHPHVQLVPQYLPSPAAITSPHLSGYIPHKAVAERDSFYSKLHAFRERIGQPIQRLPTLGFKELDLWVLYNEVTKRNGIDTVIANKQWKEVAEALQLPSSCTDSGFRLRLHYKKYLEAFERQYFKPTAPTKPLRPTKKRPSTSTPSAASATTQAADDYESASAGSGTSTHTNNAPFAPSHSNASRKRALPRHSINKTKKKRRNSLENVPTPSPKTDTVSESPSKVPEATKQCAAQSRTPSTAPDSSKHSSKSNTPSIPSSPDLRVVRNLSAALEPKKEEETEAERAREDKAKCEAVVDEVEGGETRRDGNKVDFSVLGNSSLKRYAKVYHVEAPMEATSEGNSKRQLADSVAKHFSATPLKHDETETLLRFIQAVRKS